MLYEEDDNVQIKVRSARLRARSHRPLSEKLLIGLLVPARRLEYGLDHAPSLEGDRGKLPARKGASE